MVNLYLRDYCQECPHFEVQCDEFSLGDGRKEFAIKCRKRDRCDLIKSYLERKAVKS